MTRPGRDLSRPGLAWSVLLCALGAGASGAGPKEVVAEYLRRDADGGLTSSEGFQSMSGLFTWPTGPGWDTFTVVRSSRIVSAQQEGKSATVVVEYAVAGILDSSPAFRPEPRTERAELHLVRTSEKRELTESGDEVVRPAPEAWRIRDPQNQPHLSLQTARRIAEGWATSSDERQRADAPAVLRALRAASPAGQ